MTCAKFTEGTLSDYTDGALGPLQTLRVRQHLRQCAHCAGEVTALQNLNRDARQVYVGNVPTATPVRSHPRRVVLRPLLAVGAAVGVAGLWFAPEMPGRPRVAFADVESAMRQVETAQWKSTYIIYDGEGKREEQLAYDHWARLKPLLYATRCRTLFPPPATTDRSAEETSRITEFESVLRDRKGKWYRIAISDAERAHGIRIPVEMNINIGLFPHQKVAQSSPRALASASNAPKWKQDRVQVQGRSLLHFQQTITAPKFRLIQEMWVEPTTHRLFRRVSRHTFYRQSKTGAMYPWRNVVNIADQFRYNKPVPEEIAHFAPPH